MKRSLLIVSIALLCGMSCCRSSKEEKDARSSPGLNPRVELNWADSYYGVVPGKDCSGRLFEITLSTDLSYTLKRTCIEGRSDPVYDSGTFSWNDAGTEIALNDGNKKAGLRRFLVEENKLVALDAGNPPNRESNLRDYTLFKMEADTTDLYNKHWRLVEIMGKPVSFSGIRANRAFIYFRSDGRVHGNLGCNTFHGDFVLQTGNKIQFSNLTNTLKTCFDMSIEETFKQILPEADNYFLDDDELVLNREQMQPLAKFEATEQSPQP
ncbi:MAG: META domain-containing protein [Dysgonamonadaceae bacterium]|jgi:heat shock protein HslJ|nr:META domain-containing protein [Dysgonamonadaceae bacterium]